MSSLDLVNDQMQKDERRCMRKSGVAGSGVGYVCVRQYDSSEVCGKSNGQLQDGGGLISELFLVAGGDGRVDGRSGRGDHGILC